MDLFSYLLGRKSGGGSGEVLLQDKTITENGEYTADTGYDGLGKVTVEVAGSGGIAAGISYDEFDSLGNLAKATVYGSQVQKNAFYEQRNLTTVNFANDITAIGGSAFYRCNALTLSELPPNITQILDYTFNSCSNITITAIPSGVTRILSDAFRYCYAITELTFKGTPTEISANAFRNCGNLTVINVPWAEGAVANAPWGATDATINYNYTGA